MPPVTTTEAEVRQVIRELLAGRWSLGNARQWFQVRQGDHEHHQCEPAAAALATAAFDACCAGFGGATREQIETRLAELAAEPDL